MKKAISLLTSMMVMSLVAANMAIPASAAGEVTLDIDDITLTVDELQANEKVTVDGSDYYAVDLDILYTDTTGDGIGSFTLAFDTDSSTLGLNPSNSSGTKYAFTGYGDDESYVFKDLDSSLKSKRGTLLIFNADVEDTNSPIYPNKLADGTTRKALAVSVLVPADATDGTYSLVWDQTKNDDFFAADGSTAIVPTLKDGSITIGDGGEDTTTTTSTPVETKGEISIGNVEVEVTGDALTEDTVVKVPVSIKSNPGFATADIYHELTIAAAASGATASYAVDGTKLVLDAGDLTTDKDLEGAATGKFPGKVMVVQNDAENITGDGVIYYVEITVSAGAKVGDKFDITFDKDGGDFELYNADDMSTAMIPALVDGSITLVGSVPPIETTGEISLEKKVVELTADDVEDGKLVADMSIPVAVSISENPGFATADIYHDLTVTSDNGVTATYDVDGTKLVLTAGDLTTDKDIEGAATGKFPGKVMVVQNDAENITGDGVIYYVNITVPAGTSVDDVFSVNFDEDGGDFELYNADDMSTAMIPALVNGSISFKVTEETTTTPEETTTTEEETTTTPEETTTTPEETTTTPEETTTTPEETTTTPEETTTTPEETTTTPEETTTTPEETTTTPEPTTTTPVETTTTIQTGTGSGSGNGGGDVNVDVSGPDVSVDVSAGGGDVSADVSAGGADVSVDAGDNSNSNENGNTIENNPTINITVNGGGSSDGTQAPTTTQAPTGTTSSAATTAATTTKATTAATTTTKATTTAKSSDSPSTGSTGIGATIMAMIAAAASAFALKKKND